MANPNVKITAAAGKIELRLGGPFAPREVFNAFRAAVAGSKALKRKDGWVNVASLADAPAILERLNAVEGLDIQAAPEVLETIKDANAAAQESLDEAKGRVAQIEAELAARGGALYDYQRTGIPWLASKRGAILADDMGLGKTLQALLAVPKGAPILVIGPSVAKGVWVRETKLWRPDLSPVALYGRGSFRWPEAGELVVTNYDILPPDVLADEIDDCPADCVVILDEAHAVKNHKTLRHKRCKAIINEAFRAGGKGWLLTATPLLNRPMELWNLLKAVDLQPFSGFKEFAKLFGGYQDYVWNGRSNVAVWKWGGTPKPEGAERIKPHLLRRLKSEVLTDLPPKRYATIDVDSFSKSDVAAWDEALTKWNDEDELPDFYELSAERAKLAKVKTPAMLKLVEEYEEAETPLVVFSAHRFPIDTLAERDGWAVITGDTPPEKRTEIEDAFQAGLLKGVGATIKAGGVAITLTRASHAIFVDRDWTPALNSQAEDRIYRIGQNDSVLVTDMVADHVLDRRIYHLLVNKQRVVEAGVDAARRNASEEATTPDIENVDSAAAEPPAAEASDCPW